MPDHTFAESLRTTNKFFNTATQCFDESDSAFVPKPGMFTVAQHVAHTAQVIEWFVDGAFAPDGMNTDYDRSEREVRAVTSLKVAREWMERAVAKAIDAVEKKSRADFQEPIAGPVMTGEPRHAICEAIADHTAHHRGALAVYARLIGKAPAMPYS